MSNLILSALHAHAADAPQRIALLGQHGPLDYGSLAWRVNTLAAWLRARGVRRAALWGENSPEWIVGDLAAWQAGVTLVPLPAFLSAGQLQHAFASAGLSHAIVCGALALPLSSGNWQPTPVPDLSLVELAPPPTVVALPPATCKITFTSGTTGLPKGVCLSTHMLEAVTRSLAARIHGAATPTDALQAHFTMLPLGTLLENVAGVYVPLLLGKRVIVRAGASIGLLGSSRLDVTRLVQALQCERPNSLIVLPQILRALVGASAGGLALPDSLRFVAVGGAHTPATLIEHARALGLPVYEGYGLSECASVVALNAPGADRPGSVGRVLEHLSVRVEEGVIQIAGSAFPGYLGQPTREATGWLDTGDVGHIDPDGFLHVTGRRSNVLISTYGRNISPEWVEAELASCPSISQAMVLGDAQPFLGAIVVPSRVADAVILAREIANVNARLPDYARVRRFIVAAAPFTVANHCLTDNGRLRRAAIATREGVRVAALFESDPTTAKETAHDVF
jgi:long-chain acyl-CoA synthetase